MVRRRSPDRPLAAVVGPEQRGLLLEVLTVAWSTRLFDASTALRAIHGSGRLLHSRTRDKGRSVAGNNLSHSSARSNDESAADRRPPGGGLEDTDARQCIGCVAVHEFPG